MRRASLKQWFHTKLIPRFEGRILPVTYAVAEQWGTLDAQAKLKGRAIKTADGLIAATALEYGLTLVTRNVRDFDFLDIPLLDPWTLT
jgi:predicted nucleic acid-binding protein